MRHAIAVALLLFFPTVLQARVIKWEGKPVSVSISTERLTRIEFPETLRSVFLSRSDIGVEREERSLYVRALAPDARRLSDRSLSAIDRTVPDLRADTPTTGVRSKCILIHTQRTDAVRDNFS